ncbi:MAG: TRAP transporter large permease subunit, partial [Burkholderiaceae bacterium]
MSTLSFSLVFLLMIVLMLLGVPIAVAMVLVGAGTGLVVFGVPFLSSTGAMLWGVLNDNLLTAAPLFILLGELLLRSGMADRMYGAMAAWLSRLPGGLLHTNVACCALFAATSGSSVATAATIGTVALPSLQARKYPMPQALGTLAAGGTLGILIPPSINMIVYGSLTENSIGKLFIAGVIPGLLLTGAFMLYVLVSSLVKRDVPHEALPPLAERLRVSVHLIPPLVIFGIVMGSLYTGIATATESAALGVVVALVFAWKAGRLSWSMLETCFLQTA